MSVGKEYAIPLKHQLNEIFYFSMWRILAGTVATKVQSKKKKKERNTAKIDCNQSYDSSRLPGILINI